jgi:hypothetical protein
VTGIRLPRRVDPHTPLRPLWLCRSCGTPWPCALARLQLKAEYHDNRPALTGYLGTILAEAEPELRRLNPAGDRGNRPGMVAVSVLDPGDEKFHYHDGSHRWIPPDPDTPQQVWDEMVRQHKEKHLNPPKPVRRPGRC